MDKTFALAEFKNSPCRLWCRRTKTIGTVIHFHVINGAWDGRVDTATGEIWIEEDTEPSKTRVEIVWEGRTPNYGYNLAMEWIDKQRKIT